VSKEVGYVSKGVFAVGSPILGNYFDSLEEVLRKGRMQARGV
jgi:hypothetical protein